jgi:hypothetical protein
MFSSPCHQKALYMNTLHDETTVPEGGAGMTDMENALSFCHYLLTLPFSTPSRACFVIWIDDLDRILYFFFRFTGVTEAGLSWVEDG